MKVKLYVRVARHHRLRRGIKVETSQTYKGQPLTVGSGFAEQAIYTAHFVLNLDIPEEMLRPGALPEINVTVDPAQATGLVPVVEQEEAPA